MMGSMTRGWSARAIDASTRPVPLLFIPRPNISEVRWAGVAFSSHEIDQPAANASTHKATTRPSVTTRKSRSGSATAWGSETEALE